MRSLITVLAIAAALAGCTSMPSMSSGNQGVPPGMNEKGEVIDSTKVEPGSGTKVTGIDGLEGEIVGKPAKNSKFTQLQIGMTNNQVIKLIGEPTTQAKRVTGKIYIPMYFGKDRNRLMMIYKGQGRLVFSGGSYGNENAFTLLYVIHNANESGDL
jgi:uncharacterized protein YceK